MNPDKIRNVLNILFMILAVAAIITYFVVGKEDFKMFIYVCGAADRKSTRLNSSHPSSSRMPSSA